MAALRHIVHGYWFILQCVNYLLFQNRESCTAQSLVGTWCAALGVLDPVKKEIGDR